MEIKFEQQGLLYVAEFEVASNCNLHIERESRGAFTIAQRGTKQGKYAYITDENYDDRTIIDVDMLGNIYPKYIKITSVSKPTYAEVNFAEQGGGGNSGDDMIYKDVRSFNNARLLNIAPLIKALVITNDSVSPNETGIYAGPSSFIYNNTGSYLNIVKEIYAIGFNPKDTLYFDGIVCNFDDSLKQLSEELYTALMACPDITKEQFYNLEA